eukprot:6208496-Pleurochrysis_carterae.AAC.4
MLGDASALEPVDLEEAGGGALDPDEAVARLVEHLNGPLVTARGRHWHAWLCGAAHRRHVGQKH